MIPARSSHRVWAAYAAAVTLYGLLFAVWQAEPVPDEVYVAGILAAAVCMLPLVLWYVRGRLGTPMFELICLAYLVQYAMPVFLHQNSIVVLSRVVYLPWSDDLASLELVTLGVGALIAGFFLAQRSALAARIGRIDLPMAPARSSRYIVWAIATGLLMSALQHFYSLSSGSLGFALRILGNQFPMALVLLAYGVYRSHLRDVRWTVLLYGSAAIDVMFGLYGGTLQDALVPLVLLFVVRWHVRRKLPGVMLAAGIIAFVLLNSVKAEYRQVAYGGSYAGVPDRLALWGRLTGDAVETIAAGDVLGNSAATIRTASGRLDFLHTLAFIHSQTPSRVPYRGGRTYAVIATTWIPRAILPDKATVSDADHQMAVDYGLELPFQTASTEIGIGNIGEAYANFGAPGVLLVLALVGALFGLVDRVFNGPDSEGGVAVYLSIMVFFLDGIGSTLGLLVGAIVQNTAPNVAILRLFARSWGVPAKNDANVGQTEPPQLARPANVSA